MQDAFDKWASRWESVVAEMLIYRLISSQPRYGRELITAVQTHISQRVRIPTIYAIVNRGQTLGLLEKFKSSNKDSITRGTERKYFRLTRKGSEYLHTIASELQNAIPILDFIESGNEVQFEKAVGGLTND